MKAENRKIRLEAFFKAYAKRFSDAIEGKKPDVDGVVGSFADSFIESSPVGIITGNNNAEFKKAIPRGYEHYKSLGILEMSIVSNDITLLDDLHSMVKVHWKSVFQRKDDSRVTIEFDVFYLLTEKDDNPRIFAYITGDEQKAIEDNGLEPYK